jgi:hypothetical protein
LLAVSLDELFGTAKPAARGKRDPVSQLERSIERIGELPKQKQRFVIQMLETVLAQANG